MSDIKIEFNNDCENALEHAFKKQFNSGGISTTIPCPYCSAPVSVIVGENQCSSCGKLFDVGTEPYRQ